MAGSTHHVLQSPITCDICNSCENVDGYCLGCKGNMCSTCQVSHTKSRMFKTHQIIPIIQGLRLQSAEKQCSTHLPYVCSFHCITCYIPVCVKCITSDHRGHEIVEIEPLFQGVQQEIREYHEALKNIYLLQCKGQVAEIKQDIAECKKFTISVKSQINDQRTEVITEVHNVCDDMISQAEDEEKCLIADMENNLQNFHYKIKEIKQLMTKSMEVLAKSSFEQNKFNIEKPSLAHFDVQKVASQHLPILIAGKIDTNQIAEQIGFLMPPRVPQIPFIKTDIDVSIVQRKRLGKGIRSVYAVDANHAWFNEAYPGKGMSRVTIDGKEIKWIAKEIVIEDFVLTPSGDIIATDYDGRCIRIITQAGQVTATISTNPFQPSGVCLGNKDQEIVVCVNMPDNSNSKLVVYSKDGNGIRTINYTDQPVRNLLVQRITQNNKGDYCVAHWGHKNVYVMDSDGSLRYSYDSSGSREMKETFFPYDICSDIYDNMFISDYNNHNIHMLDDEGKFLRILLTEHDRIAKPTGLCINKDGNLLVGQRYDGLCIVKYLK